MFPSWQRHSVTRYLGDGTLVSIAFDLGLRPGRDVPGLVSPCRA